MGTIGGQIYSIDHRREKKKRYTFVSLIPATRGQHVWNDAKAETAGGLYLQYRNTKTIQKWNMLGGKCFANSILGFSTFRSFRNPFF